MSTPQQRRNFSQVERRRWLIPLRHVRHPKLSLILLAHAGGSVGVFRSWGNVFSPDIEPIAVQLPGRDARFTETPFKRMEPLMEELTAAVAAYIEGPFALFGHSMGAALAFELARSLRERTGCEPLCLFVSALQAPRAIRWRFPPTYTLPDTGFIEALRQLGDVPPGLFGPPELLETLLPTLRADFELIETWAPRPGNRLSCPVFAIRGYDDPLVNDEALEMWRYETSGNFGSFRFPGGHFYYVDCPPLFSLLADCLVR